MGDILTSEFVAKAAWPLLLAGALASVRGACVWWSRSLRDETGPARTLSLVRGLRCVLVGGAAVAFAAGLLCRNPVLAGIGLAIGCEEFLETSAVILALRDELARRAAELGPQPIESRDYDR